MSTRNLSRPKPKYVNLIWMGVFILMVIAILSAIYYATQQIDYVWRWYSVPKYFIYQDNIEVLSETEGDITALTPAGKNLTMTISNDDGRHEYSGPEGSAHYSVGDYVYPDDILFAYKKWKPGILVLGMWLTLKVSFISIIFGVIIGMLTGLARISDNPALKWSAITYIEIIRGSPLLVQIFIWYFVLGTLINTILSKQGIPSIPPLWFGVAALAGFAGAYVAEIVRAGIQSIHRGQTEASRSLGMTYPQTMRHVILPQAMRRIIPPLAGQFISLIKDSSLLGIIAIRELTKATREVVTVSLQPFELWFVCALLYLILTFTFSMFLQYLERRATAS